MQNVLKILDAYTAPHFGLMVRREVITCMSQRNKMDNVMGLNLKKGDKICPKRKFTSWTKYVQNKEGSIAGFCPSKVATTSNI